MHGGDAGDRGCIVDDGGVAVRRATGIAGAEVHASDDDVGFERC